MTQDEIIRMAVQCQLVTTGNRDGLYMEALIEFAKRVEARATSAEPVAWHVDFGNDDEPNYASLEKPNEPKATIRPLVFGDTSPPQRQPLTDEQIHAVIRSGEYDSMEDFARVIEAAHGIKGKA